MTLTGKLRRSANIALVLAGLAVLGYWLRPLLGCGPFSPTAVFSRTRHPDPPFDRFARGELGVVLPGYAQSFLFVAYRYLAGVPLGPDEQAAVLGLWQQRMLRTATAATGADNWLKARAAVPGSGPAANIHGYRWEEKFYFSYLNCQEDAFVTASATLKDRISRFGAASAEVKEWLRGQDAVFANCSGNSPALPAPAPDGAVAVIRSDRAYQIAAARFYRREFDEAEKGFQAIAADPESPWRRLAPYLAVRCLVRKATLSVREGADQVLLREAEERLKKILSDAALRETHDAAGRLLGFVRFRLYPEQRLRDAAKLLVQPGGGVLGQNLADYTLLLDRVKLDARDDLTDWILTFQQQDHPALDHSLQRWRETSSPAWLVASLAKINAAHEGTAGLLEAATKVPADSPAHAAVQYHAIRLLKESGQNDGARLKLDALLAGPPDRFPPSTRNLFVAQRLDLARNLDEFLRDAQRKPLAVYRGGDDLDLAPPPADPALQAALQGPLLDSDSTRILNKRLPLSVLAQAALRPVLSERLRREVAVAAWVRAALLDQPDIAAGLVPLPPRELQAAVKDYQAAPDASARRFAAAVLLLHHPGLRPYIDTGVGRLTPPGRIDDFRDNWWCRFDQGQRLETPNLTRLWAKGETAPDPDADLPYPSFLTEPQKAAARREWTAVVALGAAPDYLSRQAVEWSRSHADDPRVPEALHLAVRSTRYGCTSAETSRWSRTAFQLLHSRYPQSEWTAQTKYWY